MRIGVDVGPLAVRTGGIPRYVEKLVASLSGLECGHDFVLCGAIDPALAPPAVRPLAWDGRRVPLARWAKQLHPIGAGSLDLFHATNYLPPLLARVPTVLTVHDLSVHLFPESHGWPRRLRHRLLPAMCRRAARVIADSLNTKRDLVRHYGLPDERIDVVYLAAGQEFTPVSDEAARSHARLRYRLPERFVLYVGSLDPRKNLVALIHAHARLRRAGCPLPLVLGGVGAPRHVERLRAEALAHGLVPGETLLLPGHVEDADLPALYSQCELFVYPSLYEGFGLPPLEAMACGAPVLVPDNSAFSELYRGTRLLFDLDDPAALTEAMAAALGDRARRQQIAEEGRKRAGARSWEDVAAETVACFERALETG
ncbi:MAG TPA: glycosyltransferase family 1 protein [Myxococcota bacterium]|jgi:glycosyltransferase involved in cell wall biosynthesis|nr:glycosyltransferase family 1 protein [Myxococcota bacterium]